MTPGDFMTYVVLNLPDNIAVCFAPTLFRNALSGTSFVIIEFIEKYDRIFGNPQPQNPNPNPNPNAPVLSISIYSNL